MWMQVFRLVFVQKWTENGQGLCGTSVNQTQVYVAMHIYLYQFVLQFMLPATAIFFCNIVILYRIYHLRYGTNQLLRRDVGTGTLQQQAAEPSRRHLLQAPHHPAAPTQSPHHSAPAAAGVGQASKHQNQQQQPSSSIPLQRQVGYSTCNAGRVAGRREKEWGKKRRIEKGKERKRRLEAGRGNSWRYLTINMHLHCAKPCRVTRPTRDPTSGSILSRFIKATELLRALTTPSLCRWQRY